MKKTSLMQKTHSLLSSKAWKNGLALLLLLCFVGTTQVSAQSLNTGMEPSSEYVSTADAVKMLEHELVTLETTVRVVTMADKMERKFYRDVQANILNGMSVEAALEATRTKMIQKAAELGSFTVQDVDNAFNVIDDIVRI